MKVLKVKNINKSYGKHKVLNNFSMEINEGEIVSIIGPSGARKINIIKMYK